MKKKLKMKMRNKIAIFFAIILSVFYCCAFPVFADLTDVQIWQTSNNSTDTFHCYLSYQNNVSPAGNMYNGTTPMYNLYEMPFQVAISRTQLDGSAPTSNNYWYLYGWGFKKVVIEFNVNVSNVNVFSPVVSDACSVYIEKASYDSSSKKLTLDMFFTFDNFPVNRIDEVCSFVIGCRRNTSALNDTLSIVSVTTSDWAGSIDKSSSPSTGGSMVESIVRAINSSTDIDSIISILNALDDDLLTEVLPQIENINGVLANIYSRLGNINNNVTVSNAILQKLVLSLAGVEYNSGSNLADATYNRWVQIITDALNQTGDSSASDDSADNVADGIASLDDDEQSVYDSADTAMSELTFNQSAPGSITLAAYNIMYYVNALFNASGEKFQYLVWATLTVGLIISVVGIINSYAGKGGSSRGRSDAGGRED